MLPTLASLFYHFDITVETPEPNFLRSLKTRAQIEKSALNLGAFFLSGLFCQVCPCWRCGKMLILLLGGDERLRMGSSDLCLETGRSF